MSKQISARRVVFTSFVVDLSDFILSVILAVISGSAVMLSQALQGAADMFTSALLIIGVQRSKRRANHEFQFGYGRELFFWILMSGTSMFAISSSFSIYFGIRRLIAPDHVEHIGQALFVLFIGLVTNAYALRLSTKRLFSDEINVTSLKQALASSLVETKATLFLDLMGTAAAVLGIIALGIYHLTGNPVFDAIGAIVVGAVTAILAVYLIAEGRDFLVGKGAGRTIEHQISDAAKEIEGVRDVLDLKTMFLGVERLLVNLEAHLDPHLSTKQIEHLTDLIKDNIKKKVPMVGHVQVEVETPTRKD